MHNSSNVDPSEVTVYRKLITNYQYSYKFKCIFKPENESVKKLYRTINAVGFLSANSSI